MLLGRVIGSAWATRQYEGMEGNKMLVVQLLDKHRRPLGRPAVAVDVVDAGEGDLVFLVRAREASLAMQTKGLPVDLAIVGVIDTVDVRTGFPMELRSGYTGFA
jgi:ethanolamine utilization protein EutN